ncbi:MBL fold metallo-hydrolase [Proteus terrae]|uniref:MBL fold metallo-hydrolase n=1 Tax=Proteus terrae TaxID=1574161 RepID=UPI0028898A00|nr:MBL fold metallo-hydrolase [Proteus terrae]
MMYHIVPVTNYMQNCTLIWCDETKEAAIVDPGGDVETLIAEIEARQLTLTKVLLTHGHFDHIAGTSQIVEHFNVPIYGPHKDDNFLLEELEQQCRMFNFPCGKSFTPDSWLNEGDTVTIGKTISLAVLHCPGHTPGHIIFVNHQNKIISMGDVLFKESIGRTDFPRGNHADLIASIKNKVLPLGDDYLFIPGHGPMSNLGHERQFNPFLQDEMPIW